MLMLRWDKSSEGPTDSQQCGDSQILPNFLTPLCLLGELSIGFFFFINTCLGFYIWPSPQRGRGPSRAHPASPTLMVLSSLLVHL